jgi:hypothetical protein
MTQNPKVVITLHQLYDENPLPNIEKKEFLEVTKIFLANLMEAIKETGYTIKLPNNLGHLGIIKRKLVKSVVDFGHYVSSDSSTEAEKTTSSSYKRKKYNQ